MQWLYYITLLIFCSSLIKTSFGKVHLAESKEDEWLTPVQWLDKREDTERLNKRKTWRYQKLDWYKSKGFGDVEIEVKKFVEKEVKKRVN